MSVAGQSPDAEELCVGCGLCCNGVLYSRGTAQLHEVERLRATGLVIDQVADRSRFQQPCQHHHEGRCTIYPDRPSTCRTFRCALLQRLDGGDITLSEAIGAVAKAKRMVASVAALDPSLRLVANRTAFRREASSGAKSRDGQIAKQLLESTVLDVFLDRTFRTEPVVWK
jgi:uncharacterized protein